MFKHFLVPIDDSQRCERAVDTAIALAAQLGAGITAFIAEPPAPPPQVGYGVVGAVQRMNEHDRETTEHAQRLLEAVQAKAARAGIRCEGVWCHSNRIAPAIVEAAQQHRCDLIVMATHVHGAFADWLSPSHTKGVMARGDVPLLVVH